ncbi:PqqD family protein [Paenibacillus methanolicus]|uniref:Coenzyme PQQ synthesis protein D (PqqD) n=1 Tax=Paenibacillus methanolicus TaxID=582686 RepID=A0A5S5BS80_9BACL|nr:PqqD family protein [Paenibacillus methanolicus]TYP69146.1 coenzyme PQQ synthesis protein D (PqqD) [Paenibacillus methanolicus]
MTWKYKWKTNCDMMELEELCMVMDLDNYTVSQLNEVGSFCWRQLEEPHSVEQLSQAVCETFEINASDAAMDVQAFVDDLLARNLVESVRD